MKKMFLLISCLGLFATSALAQSETHDGFFLRLAPGFGHMESKSNGVTFDGTDGYFSLMLGGAIQENTILHVELATGTITDPSGTGGVQMDGDLSTSIFGIGMTQYFMPANAYVSFSVGPASQSLDSHGTTFESDRGLGVNVTVGKEWWVSDNWGLGVAGHLLYANVGGGDLSSSDIKTLAYGILFSATYN